MEFEFIRFSHLLLNSARHIHYLGHHQSINGIWLLIFLMYVFTTRTSFDLMRCVPMYDVDDNFKVNTSLLDIKYYH